MTSTNLTMLIRPDSGITMPSLEEIKARSVEDQMEFVFQAKAANVVLQVAVGEILINLKASVEHGQFLELLDSKEIADRTANRYMAFARFVKPITRTNPAALSRLDMSSWLAVKDELDEPALVQFVGGAQVRGLTLDEAQNKTSRELKQAFEDHKKTTNAELTALKSENVNLKTRLETAQLEAEALVNQSEFRRTQGDYPEQFLITRIESRALSTKAGLCLDDLETLATENLSYAQKAGDEDFERHYAEVANASVYCHIKALAARFAALERTLAEKLPDKVTGPMQDEQFYSEEEIAIAVRREHDLRDEHLSEKLGREYAKELKRGPGRPPVNKTKK